MLSIRERVPMVEPGVAVRSGASTIAGRRQNNEDCFTLCREHSLWAVSDGIGGAPFGDVMSRVACNVLSSSWTESFSETEINERLRRTVQLVNEKVSGVSDLLGNLGSGSTLLIAHLCDSRLWVASVGDCAAFLIREGAMRRLNFLGRTNRHSNGLDEALGYHLELNPEVSSYPIRPGDVVLLCSDGVWSTQDEEQMAAALFADVGPSQVAHLGNPQVMAEYVTQGSDMSDNATAVVLVFGEAATRMDPDETSSFPIIGDDEKASMHTRT